jgi:predicted amidohydrolase YtcJ
VKPHAGTLVFRGGPVFGYTGGATVGCTDGVIVAVGDEGTVREVVGPRPEVIDLDGRMLTPGFQDAHIHPVMGGLIRMRCDLESATDAPSAAALVGRYSREHPGDPWIRGGGWKYDWFEGGNPTAAALDAVTDRPVYLVVADGHSAWANSLALEMAGITADTPDPADGVIVRTDDGSPAGTLHEGAMDLVERIVPPTGAADREQALLASQSYLLGLGITAWQDAWVTSGIDAAYRRLAADGRLLVRVRGALWWDRERGIEQLDEITARASGVVGGYHPGTVKLMLDGVAENQTASMLDPWLDDVGRETRNRGIDFIDPVELPEIVTRIDAAGLQCHFHALGDRAVRNALDALEAARERNGPSPHRPHLAHIQIIHPDDVPRFAALGAAANIQPLWAVADESMTRLTTPYLGDERSRLQYPFGSLRDAGATLAMGSDWSVSTPDVLQQIAVAVDRTSPADGIDEPFLPEQRLTLDDAILAATAGAAHVNFLDGDSGRIAPGLRADLAVISGDPRTEPIHELTVDMTVLGGEIVHDAWR